MNIQEWVDGTNEILEGGRYPTDLIFIIRGQDGAHTLQAFQPSREKFKDFPNNIPVSLPPGDEVAAFRRFAKRRVQNRIHSITGIQETLNRYIENHKVSINSMALQDLKAIYEKALAYLENPSRVDGVKWDADTPVAKASKPSGGNTRRSRKAQK